MNFKVIVSFLMMVFSLLTPFFIGFALAFILNKPHKMFTRTYSKLFKKEKNKKYANIFAIVTTYLLAFALVAALISFIVPQLAESISTLVENFDGYTDNFLKFIDSLKLVDTFDIDISNFDSVIQNLIATATTTVKTFLPYIFTFTSTLIKTITNLAFGIIISIYILASKDTLKAQVKGLIYAFIPKRKADKFYEIARITSTTFSNFITGQLTEVIILGVFCFVGMMIFDFPYAILISTIVGLTNVVPIVGPFIGAIPSTFIILLVNPTKAIWFIVFFIIIQQIEGDIIYPKVVGDSIGLPAIWVLLSIIVGGGLFGVIGMVIGVPVTSVIYRLIKKETKERLERQEIILRKEAKMKNEN
jgi:predicted PurR-regulated permease PerM